MELPDMRDYEAVQRFFIKEVQLGEELLAAGNNLTKPTRLYWWPHSDDSGDIDNGIEHLSSAVAVCGQPQQLLQVLQQTLPPQVFHLLLQRLPIVSQVCAQTELIQEQTHFIFDWQKLAKTMAASEPTPITEVMTEDDVEWRLGLIAIYLFYTKTNSFQVLN